MSDYTLLNSDCIYALRKMPDNSVDSIVTDPPYGLHFMGKKWDKLKGKGTDFKNNGQAQQAWHYEWAKECLRVLKPGGYLLSFGGTRTYHRLACAIEDAGFEIRDMIEWVYGQGFSKSRNIWKTDLKPKIEKQLRKQGVKGGIQYRGNESYVELFGGKIKKYKVTVSGYEIEIEQNDDGKFIKSSRFKNNHTALKPAHEPIVMARKPISEKNIVENVLKWGTGGINIDSSRVPLEKDCRLLKGGTYGGNRGSDKGNSMFGTNKNGLEYNIPTEKGRFPANFIHDGSNEVKECFPDAVGQQGAIKNHSKSIQSPNGIYGKFPPRYDVIPRKDNTKSASRFFKECNFTDKDIIEGQRFFYCAKTSKKDRNEGMEDFEAKRSGSMKANIDDGNFLTGSGNPRQATNKNTHPTVKPTALMRYLVRLVTPKGGIVLDPFMGSGSTGKACMLEGFDFVGIEKEFEYYQYAYARIEYIKNVFNAQKEEG